MLPTLALNFFCEYSGAADYSIGKRMKQARTNAGINQRDMSVKLALTNSSYSNYENGYSEPPVETILKFCDILGITLNDLLEVKVVAPKTASIKTEYKMWLEDTLKLFNVPIEDFV